MHNAFVLKVGYWVVLAEYSDRAERPLTTGAIYKCKQLLFDSPEETLVYDDDLQLVNNFVSDRH